MMSPGCKLMYRLRRGTILIALTIDLEPQSETLRVWNLIRGDQPRAYRAKCVGALSLHPLPGPLKLVGSLGDIVDDAIAGHMGECIGFRDILRLGTDHHSELDLPISLFRVTGQDGLIVRSADG
jgi:hypothetical protein